MAAKETTDITLFVRTSDEEIARWDRKRINIYNPSTGITSPEPLVDIYRFIPARVVHFRVFSLTHDHDEALAHAAEKALGSLSGQSKTNI